MINGAPDGGAAATATEQAATSADDPWPGLLTYRESDTDYFQGRKAETEDLLRFVLRERMTVLYGLSGLGKSSLLQAGLFPRLRKEHLFPVHVRFDFTPVAPDFAQQLRLAIVAAANSSDASRSIEVPAATDGETLWEFFHRVENIIWNATNEPVAPLLVLDQFEELFTLGTSSAGVMAATTDFIAQLADLVEGRIPEGVKARIDGNPSEAKEFTFTRHQYKVLISVREDFLADLEALRVRMPMVGFNRLRLGRMNGKAGLQVVNQAPHLIDPDVAERVVRFVGADSDATPLEQLEIEPALLSVVCREINMQRAKRGEPRITANLLEGSQEQVLSEFYERSTHQLLELREFIEDRLLTRSGYRDSVAVETALTTPGITAGAIALAIERRLLRREDRGVVPRIELTHDLLVRVVKANRNSRQAREAAEAQQVLLDRQQAEMVTTLHLAKEEAERQQAEANAKLASAREEAERQLQLSALEQRQVRVFRIATVISALLGVVAIGAATFAYRKQTEAVHLRQIADSSNYLTQRSLRQFTQRLVEQTRSPDGALALSAIEQLASAEGLDKAVNELDDATLKSNLSIALIAEILDTIRTGPRSDTARALRPALLRRMATVRKIDVVPSRERDEAMNRRVAIAGGSFAMGSPASSGQYAEKPQRTVTLAPFLMQEHEVTNGEYRRFAPSHNTGAPDDLPAVAVSWYDAMAYAIWLGGSLPTEAQWEFAARGASGRTYPWGNEPPNCARANITRCVPSALKPVKVGREAGRTPAGVYDLVGNAFEWCRDWYAGDYRSAGRTDPVGPPTGSTRVLRGGSFNPDSRIVRAAARSFNRPEVRNYGYGFRVVWPGGVR